MGSFIYVVVVPCTPYRRVGSRARFTLFGNVLFISRIMPWAINRGGVPVYPYYRQTGIITVEVDSSHSSMSKSSAHINPSGLRLQSTCQKKKDEDRNTYTQTVLVRTCNMANQMHVLPLPSNSIACKALRGAFEWLAEKLTC